MSRSFFHETGSDLWFSLALRFGIMDEPARQQHVQQRHVGRARTTLRSNNFQPLFSHFEWVVMGLLFRQSGLRFLKVTVDYPTVPKSM